MNHAPHLPAERIAPPLPEPIAVIPQPYQQQPGLSLAQIFSILRAYRKQSILIACAVAGFVALAALLLPKTYTATADLMVNFEVNDPLDEKEFPSGLIGNYIATQVELIQSPAVLLATVDRLKLTTDRKFTAGFRGSEPEKREWVASHLAKKLVVEEGQQGSNLIHVRFSNGDPQRAAQIANTIADVYLDQHQSRAAGPAADRAQRYTKEVAELKDKVDAAQQRLTQFRQDNKMMTTDPKSDIDLGLLATLEQRLLEAQNARRSAEVKAAANPATGDQVLNSSLMQQLKTQLAEQEAKMAGLRATLGAKHPDVLALQSQLSATRRSLQQEQANYAQNARTELDSAKDLEAKLQSDVEARRNDVARIHVLQDQAAKLQIELDSAQAVYKHALDGYDQVMFSAGGRYSSMNLITRALVPLKPSKPNVPKFIVLGILLGLVSGVLAPMVYELLNRRVRCRDDLERDHGVPVLAEFQPLALARSYA